jgi:hypothetical protein
MKSKSILVIEERAAFKLLIVAVMLYGGLCFISSCTPKPVDLVKTGAQLSVSVTNEVASVGVHSWRAVTIQIPYKCSLTISAHVDRGNSMTMMLTDSKGIERLKTHKWGSYLGEFYAPNTTAFKHTGRVNQGTYYFVVRDKHIGNVLSSSDVSVKAHIEP